MKPSAWAVAALLFLSWSGTAALAAAPEEAFLIVQGADAVETFKLSPTANQTNYTVTLAYPEQAVGDAQAQQLQAAGWRQCRSTDPVQADWFKTVDAATPDRTIHQHQTLWAKDEQLIIVKLRYFSAANAEVPDNSTQRVNLIFYTERAQEMARYLKADCTQ